MRRILRGYRWAMFSALVLLILMMLFKMAASAEMDKTVEENAAKVYGGGYAVTGQIPSVGYSTEIYDAVNGLPTSDAMCLMSADDGHIWIGGYSGVVCYDGSIFERLDTADGLTSARTIFQDSKGRIWVGTNDNGVVILEGEERTHITYEDGLPSSSIRVFAEDEEGYIYIGTTAGLCSIDSKMNIKIISNTSIDEDRVLRLDKGPDGVIYGQTSGGVVFSVEKHKLSVLYKSYELGIEKITTILADPNEAGKVYLGTDGGNVYHGNFGDKLREMNMVSMEKNEPVHWMSYNCGRVWVSSTNSIGYLDEDSSFVPLENLPLDSGIEMMTSDYQGNMWFASSTQGAMKIVTNNYMDVTERAGLPSEVTNTTCIHGDKLYIGTDSGIRILGPNGEEKNEELYEYLEGTRVRCIRADKDDNIWIATYTGDKGLVCVSADGSISNFSIKDGMPSNEVRCIDVNDDHILVGTNGGIAIIEDGEIKKVFGQSQAIKNTVILTVDELEDGTILAGSDGDGIYAIKDSSVYKYGREQGLTSDVIMRIVRDDKREVCWIITSNSIQYLSNNGIITNVETFPYNNNYDIYFDDDDNVWILSSYGIFTINAYELISDYIRYYRTYTVENGLPYAITGNSFSSIDDEGNLYLAGRGGVVRVNIDDYYEDHIPLKMAINSIYCDDEKILPDEDGQYVIPASKGRIQVIPSVIDYTMLDPVIKIFLEGGPDEGITTDRSKISALEYTALPYGDYNLNIQVLDETTNAIVQSETFKIKKNPRLAELLVVRLLCFAFVVFSAGFIVWRVMRSTVIRHQYEEISRAKDEVERANTSKSRFLANMSHEIRTPINTIMGMNEMILREDSAGVPRGYYMSVMNYAFDIRNASESLLSLINDLLDISKIESGKMHLVEQEYDVQEMLRSIVSMIRVRSIQKELTFDVVIDEILPKRLYGDMGKIKQIMLNLLTNSVKYTKEGGFVLNVDMEERTNDTCSLRLSVKDTGMGIKEEDMDKLFTAYERLEEEKNSSIQGTGLGLDISRRFAEQMNGKLWCESVYGEGSEFILTLQQRIVDATPIGIFQEHDDSESSGHYKPQFIAPDAEILVVDDNPMNLNVIRGLLKATKVFVTTADSGEDALEKIKVNHFDIVLLDHMMPGMDGIETLEKIREIYPDLPVYALTANTTAGEDFYKSKGFNGYLAKPVNNKLLETTIMKHLPESIMKKPTVEDGVQELTELPENMLWLNETEGISVEDGTRNAGGISGFLFGLELFYDTIDGNIKVLQDAYESSNIRLYTIKVHALKSSARIIGALELSHLAEQLEDAGNHKDIGFIDAYESRLIEDYAAYKEKLKRIKVDEMDNEDKDPIPEDELNDAYDALKDVIPQMDYDAVEMILGQLSEYKLPEKDAELVMELTRLLKSFEWDEMENLISR